MKKKILLLLFILSTHSLSGKENSPINEKIIYEKLQKPLSEWKIKQIENNLAPFFEMGITQKALNATIAQTKKTRLSTRSFSRYLVIDQTLYAERERFSKWPGHITFEKVLKKMLDLFDLPNLDFIVCFCDGLPLSGYPLSCFTPEKESLQAPVMAFAKKGEVKNVLLIPDNHTFCTFDKYQNETEKGSQSNRWEEKKECAFWRGGLNTVKHKKESYQDGRYHLCHLSLLHPDKVDAFFIPSKKLFKRNMEQLFKKEGLMGKHTSVENHLCYKYLPTLDGQMCTYPGYLWRLLSNSLVFKQESDEKQWFYTALKPYEHYVPIENLMEDLMEKITWAEENDHLCKEIADNATALVKKELLIEDLYIYFYHLLKNYAKLQKFGKKELVKTVQDASTWIKIYEKPKGNKSRKT